MSNVHKFIFEDEEGNTHRAFVYSDNLEDDFTIKPPTQSRNQDEEVFGIVPDGLVVKLADVHETIRTYTKYAIGAFKGMSDAKVEELNLKFGLKVGGKTGIPMLTEGSAETNFEIEVKLTFPESIS
jgi:hypothetical protein